MSDAEADDTHLQWIPSSTSLGLLRWVKYLIIVERWTIKKQSHVPTLNEAHKCIILDNTAKINLHI